MKKRVYTYLQLFKEGLIESLAGIVNIHRCVTAAIADVLGINHNYTGNRLITKAWAINQDEPDDPDPINPDPINPEPQHTYEWEYAFSASTAVPVTGWVTLSSNTQTIEYNVNMQYLHFRMYCDGQLVNNTSDYDIYYKNSSNNTIPTNDNLCTMVDNGPYRYYCEYNDTIESPMVCMITSTSGSTDKPLWFYSFSTIPDYPQFPFVSVPRNTTITNDSNYQYLWVLCIDSDLDLQNIDPTSNRVDYEAYIANNGSLIIYGPSEQYNYQNKVDVSGLNGAISMKFWKSSNNYIDITYRSQIKWYYAITNLPTDTPQYTRLSSDTSLHRTTGGYLWFMVGDDSYNEQDYVVSDGSTSIIGQSVHLHQGYSNDITYYCTFDRTYSSPNITLQKTEAVVVLNPFDSIISTWVSDSYYYVKNASADSSRYPVEIHVDVYYSQRDYDDGRRNTTIEIPVEVDGQFVTIKHELEGTNIGDSYVLTGDVAYVNNGGTTTQVSMRYEIHERLVAWSNS